MARAALWLPASQFLLQLNVNRDHTERPEPYRLSDVHPLFQDLEQAEEDSEPDWAMWNKLTAHAKVTTLDLTKLRQS